MTMSHLRDLVRQPGGNQATYTDPHFSPRPLTLWSARPRRWSPQTPVLIALHGAARNGSDYRDHWLGLVDEVDLLVVATEFSVDHFPGKSCYEFGNVLDEAGRLNPRSKWTFGLCERVFEALQHAGLTASRRYGLFGHSAGGQFVHRAVSLACTKRVVVAITANAGTYSMPELKTPYPYGLGGLGLDEADLRRILSTRITVMVGTEDTDTSGPAFPSEPAAMRQGPTRYARAKTYLSCARAEAERLGIGCSWTGIDVPGVGHQGDEMARAAAPVVSAALHAAALVERQRAEIAA